MRVGPWWPRAALRDAQRTIRGQRAELESLREDINHLSRVRKEERGRLDAVLGELLNAHRSLGTHGIPYEGLTIVDVGALTNQLVRQVCRIVDQKERARSAAENRIGEMAQDIAVRDTRIAAFRDDSERQRLICSNCPACAATDMRLRRQQAEVEIRAGQSTPESVE